MNKIVIVGHPTSGHEGVCSLLQECGMSAALPSRRDGLLPQVITAALCKAYKVAPLESVTDEEGFSQVEAAPVWQGMALDLMLGNLEQPLWGWSDPQTIYALDYWNKLDPHLTFVLVYDEPHRVLMDVRREDNEYGTSNMQDVRRLLDNWVAYNGALLRFHLRHPERSLLVHGQQVQKAKDRYVEQLQPLLDTPLATSNEIATLPGPQGEDTGSSLMSLPFELDSALSSLGVEPGQAASLLQAGPAERYLIDDLLARHPDVMQLYAELQSVANLPLDAPPREAHGAAGEAWEALMRQRELAAGLVVRLHGDVQRTNELLVEAQEKLDAELEKLNDLGRDNQFLLTQSHRVQQELEQYYLRLRDLQLAKEVAERDRRRARRRLDEMERAKEAAERAAEELRDAAEGRGSLQVELERAQADRRRCRRRLEEANREKTDVEKALAQARLEINALQSRMVAAQSELRMQLGRAPDLSSVYSRTLAATLVRRLASKVVPKSLMR